MSSVRHDGSQADPATIRLLDAREARRVAALPKADYRIILEPDDRNGSNTMETKVSATELAKNLADILNRVRYRGERFLIMRNGKAVANLGPPEGPPGITAAEL